MIFDPAGFGVVGGSVTFDDIDVTPPLLACSRIGRAGTGTVTLRYPGLSGAIFGPGIHTFRASVQSSDGSTLHRGAVWELFSASGPYRSRSPFRSRAEFTASVAQCARSAR